MSDNTPPPISPPSSSSPTSPSQSTSLATTLVTAIPTAVTVWVIGRPIGQELPELLRLCAEKGEWKPLAAALVALGLLAAPVPTLEFVKGTIGRFLPAKQTKE